MAVLSTASLAGAPGEGRGPCSTSQPRAGAIVVLPNSARAWVVAVGVVSPVRLVPVVVTQTKHPALKRLFCALWERPRGWGARGGRTLGVGGAGNSRHRRDDARRHRPTGQETGRPCPPVEIYLAPSTCCFPLRHVLLRRLPPPIPLTFCRRPSTRRTCFTRTRTRSMPPPRPCSAPAHPPHSSAPKPGRGVGEVHGAVVCICTLEKTTLGDYAPNSKRTQLHLWLLLFVGLQVGVSDPCHVGLRILQGTVVGDLEDSTCAL